MGATGFTSEHRLQKARRDLDALRYADGMHDSLNQSAGHTLLTTSATPSEGTTPDARPAAAPETGLPAHEQRRGHG